MYVATALRSRMSFYMFAALQRCMMADGRKLYLLAHKLHLRANRSVVS